MKDYRANTLHIRGILGANNAQNFDASPYGAFYTACNLIADFRPASADALFIAQYTLSTEILDNTGVGYIKQINCVLKTGGDLNINWIKPDVSVSSYNIAFNVILGLD